MEISSSKSPEFYRNLHSKNLEKAYKWLRGEDISIVRIPESSLEEHFKTKWNGDDQAYTGTIWAWRGFGELKNLTRIDMGNHSGYVVDTSDLIIGKTDDEFMFHMINTCWGVVVDFEDKNGENLRLAYHMTGSTQTKDVSLIELTKEISREANPRRIFIFYKSSEYSGQKEDVISKFKTIFPQGIDLTFHDIDENGELGGLDVAVRGGMAEGYLNCGYWDDETGDALVKRENSGSWRLNL